MDDLFDQLQQTFGSNYTIKRELRAGGMARVFVASDESLGREIVVKVLPDKEIDEVLDLRKMTEIGVPGGKHGGASVG